MTHSRSAGPLSRSFNLMEQLEDRQLLSLVVDIRLPGGGTTTTPTNVGQVITAQVWATATGANTTGTDEGLQDVYGSFVSANTGGGSALGTIKVTTVAPFNGTGSGGGIAQDLDGDGDIDLGQIDPNATTGTWLARANGMTTTGGTLSSNGQSFHIADLTFTVTKLTGVSGGKTLLEFVPKHTSDNAVAAVWREDGATQSNGGISGKGTYSAGTTVTLAAGTGGSIAGKIWNDKNSDGHRESTTEGGAGIWNVYLDVNKNAKYDKGIDPHVVTSGGGNYIFTNLKAGTYKVRIIPQVGWRKTFPKGNIRTVVLATGGTSTGRNFGMTTNTLVTGKIFNDTNNDGIQDNGETALGGWRVFADLDGDGLFNKKKDVGVLTDSAGNFSIATLPGGKYIIRPSVPTGDRVSTQGKGYVTLKLAAAQTSSTTVFGIGPAIT